MSSVANKNRRHEGNGSVMMSVAEDIDHLHGCGIRQHIEGFRQCLEVLNRHGDHDRTVAVGDDKTLSRSAKPGETCLCLFHVASIRHVFCLYRKWRQCSKCFVECRGRFKTGLRRFKTGMERRFKTGILRGGDVIIWQSTIMD